VSIVDQNGHSIQRNRLIDHPTVDPIAGNRAQLHVHDRVRIQKDIAATKKIEIICAYMIIDGCVTRYNLGDEVQQKNLEK
jgi:hypothetical protein